MRKLQRIISLIMICVLLTGCSFNPYTTGIKYLEDGEYSKAVTEFQEAIEKGKNLKDSYRGLGIALWEEKDYKGAYEAFEKALSEGAKESVTIYSLLGNCAMQIENYAKAVEYYELALTMEEISDELKKETRYNLIAAYEYVGDVNKAKEKLKEYIADYPEDESALREEKFLETR